MTTSANPVPTLTEDELQFVTFMHQNWGMTGQLVGREAAEELLGIPGSHYDKLMANDLVIEALKERGIRFPVGLRKSTDSVSEWKQNLVNKSLTPEQLIVANTMLDLVDTRTQKKKLQDLGIPTAKYNSWLKDPVFQNYMRESAEAMLGDNQHEAHLALVDRVRSGDLPSIKYYNEMMGRYIEVGKAGNEASVAVNVQQILVGIIEIITEEVDDPEIAARIADRFKSMMTAHAVANELLNPGSEIKQPEVAAARVITPELEALMMSGQEDG